MAVGAILDIKVAFLRSGCTDSHQT